ncbi:MAG: fimbrillin family protein [Bacteroidales bacterium]|nr:fimbrillin family protein [Bacteroidales bacterium]
MSNLNKIMTVSICALFALAAGCNKVHIDNNGNDRKLLLFSAESEENLTQNSTKATSSAFPDAFGVWGIARRDDGIEQDPYILWSENSLIQVNKNSSGIYEPSSAAYWFSNHTYHFIAVAPFDIDATDVNVITKEETSGADALEFKYSIAGKYTAKDYDFDLMGAVAMSEVDVAATHPSSQEIVFKHLFSQINMNVYFKDGDRTIDGSVQKIRVRNVSTQGEYKITFDNDNSLIVTCTDTDQAVNPEIVFASETALAFPQTLHILPQDVSKFELYLDFKIGSGAEALTMNDFKVNLSTANNTPSFYDYNQSRNWNITISPKASISFTIDVASWENSNVGDELEIY